MTTVHSQPKRMNRGVRAFGGLGMAALLLLAWMESVSSAPDLARDVRPIPERGSSGGPGPQHWSLIPLVKPSVPAGGGNPIDAFIRSTLAAKQLSPSPEADRRTLIRRLNYDLTGLPPTSEEVNAFAAETQSGAYDRLVTRLLASPRHGEHWARHWLDVAHFADTHGNDHDHARPHAWPYRDYVIRSLNADKPYARFVQEQVAGDVLFPDDPQATVALGFLAAGPWDDTLMVGVREDTFDHRLSQVLDRDDMVTTVMSTFQSLTVHCARCHDHKFEPISQREYYALQAVFAGVDRADRPFDNDPATHARRQDLLARRAAIRRRDPAVMAGLESPEVLRIVASRAARQAARNDAWQALDVVGVVSAGGGETTFARQQDGSFFVSGERPDRDTFIVTARTQARGIGALRLEALPDDRLPGKGPGRYEPSGNFHLTEFRVDAQESGRETHGATRVELASATADHSDRGDVVTNAIDGRPDTFWSVHPRYGEAHEAVFEFQKPLSHDAGTTLIIRLEQNGTAAHQLGRFRLTFCTGDLDPDLRAPLPAAMAALLGKPESQRTPGERQDLALQILSDDVERGLASLPEPQWVYAVTRDFPANGSHKPAVQPRPIHRLIRGDLNQPAEPVEPGSLACVPGPEPMRSLADAGDESSRRAALARWLTDDRNALLWRSIVNRVWAYHFGRGLCETPNDFGTMGGSPSHPELLDWLAVWFRDEAKGSLKALHRLMVTSDTYRQAVVENAQATAVDADNRLLGRMNRTRLTAEELRDTLLQLSGQLDLTMGGPSVVQFVAHGKATFMPDGGAPALLDYDSFPPDAPENHRRAVYRFVFRTVPDPLMDALDAPDGGSLIPVRSQSTTAIQAFALLNSPFVIRQCGHIAERIQAEVPNADAASAIFHWLLQREPRDGERTLVNGYAHQHGLANAVQVLVNSNEFFHLD